jgi:hypothetical protein
MRVSRWRVRVTQSTDQKVGGSSPSERATSERATVVSRDIGMILNPYLGSGFCFVRRGGRGVPGGGPGGRPVGW